MSNLTKQSSAEIAEALNTMEHPSFCRSCGEFRDTYSDECPECGADDILDHEDTPYYLECAIEDEAVAGKE